PKGIVVNVARGSIVDTGSLVQALEKGSIGGAGLDVVEGTEADRKALCRMENVVLTPHISGHTHESIKRQNALICDIVNAHFSGKPFKNRVV
ncbi:NAD(P)-dependent oxidoreductase, partial [Thermodesulfobacteriota bacterium]